MKKIITLLLTLALAGSFTAAAATMTKPQRSEQSDCRGNAGADTNDTVIYEQRR